MLMNDAIKTMTYTDWTEILWTNTFVTKCDT